MTPERIRRWRIRSQRLARPDHDGDAAVADVVAGAVGLQAQDESAAALGVRARSDGLTAESVREARLEDRTVVRTWSVRGTLHLVATEDLPWLLTVLGPVYVERGRSRLTDLGFAGPVADRAVDEICGALRADGPLTRASITDVLVDAGFDFDPEGQATYHLIRRAGLLGELCQVAPVDGEVAYDRIDEWASLDEPPDRETALGRLARRYVRGYGPVTIGDFASWSGLPMADVRVGWETAIESAELVGSDGDSGHYADPDPDGLDAPAPLRLLPAYDAYLLGYGSRDHAVAEEHADRVHPGGGVIRPTVVDDGRVVATWSLDRSRATPVLAVEPFEPLSGSTGDALEDEVAAVGRFLGVDVELRLGS